MATRTEKNPTYILLYSEFPITIILYVVYGRHKLYYKYYRLWSQIFKSESLEQITYLIDHAVNACGATEQGLQLLRHG